MTTKSGFYALIALLTAALAYGVTPPPDSTAGIDTLLILTADLNGDNNKDTIACHITGESWNAPVTITYTITCNNTVILSETSSDEPLDQEFGNPDMMDWCTEGYLHCKQEWYLKRVAREVLSVVKLHSQDRENLFDTTSGMSIPSIAQKFYRDSLGYSKKKAQAEARKLTAFYKDREVVFVVIPANPVYRSFPRFYDPFRKRFIQLYGL